MSRKFDIFISYPGGSPETSEHVRRLGDLLQRDGLRAWIGERDRGRGQGSPKEAISTALRTTRAFMVCLGGRKAGHLGLFEAEQAAARSASDSSYVICTVLLPGAELGAVGSLPPPFSSAPVFDFRAGFTSVAPLIPMLWSALLPERAKLLEEIVEDCRAGLRTVVVTGPPGSGKSSLSRIAVEQLKEKFFAGQAFVVFERRRGIVGMADLVLRYFRLRNEPEADRQYQRHLAREPYLVVFDDVEAADVTELVPPAPSAVFFVSRRTPRLRGVYKVFEMPSSSAELPRAANGGISTVQPGYTSDAPYGQDLLDIQGSVNALCSVIAARDVKPPLSIGLFGDWGTGKTFFIEKMRERTQALADASRSAEAGAYCSSIHQIVFNAWHYADANLWASLASHVFESLTETGTEPERLVEELESSRMLLRHANADREVAQQRVEQAQRDEEKARDDLLEAKIELRDLRDAAVGDLTSDEVEPLMGEIREALHVKEGVDITIDVAQSLRTRGGALRELVRRSWRWLVAIILLAVSAIILGIVKPEVYTVAVPASVAVLALLRVLAGPMRWVARAHSIASQRTQAMQRQRSVSLEHRLEQLRLDELDAKRREDEAQKQVAEAEQAIAEIRDGRRLFHFIEERSRGDAYGKYFGVIALVRRDFERLASLIEDHAAEVQDGAPQLQRIVLYIDDLDRCPADRVVEVLEAVHLLMASELFVVVLAVDPCWLLHSLRYRYSSEMAVVDGGQAASTPQDYLEKIFQIPFALAPMPEEGFRRLIRSLIPIEREPDLPTVGPPSFELAEARGLTLEEGDHGAMQLMPTGKQASGDIDLEPEGLRVSALELEFMSKLGGVIRTPRAAKRLANLYRLLRASLSGPQIVALEGRDGATPDFYCVQLLLAIAIASPELTALLFEAVVARRNDGGAWWDLTTSWRPPESQLETWRLLCNGMEPLRQQPLPQLSTFAQWVPTVARYSYGASLLSASSNRGDI